jgi:hypothetical protein
MENKKKHADFQDEYHKSSNFGKLDADENLKIKGNGDLKIQDSQKSKSTKNTITKKHRSEEE